jgi:phage terminase small subunit
MARGSLNARQRRFVLAFVVSGNAAQAAREAGYSLRTADRQGHDLLKNPEIAAEIARRQGKLATKLEISAENLVFAMARVAHADPRRLFDQRGKLLPIAALDDDTAFAIEAIEVTTNKAGETVTKVKLSNRNQGQANLARALGLRGFRPSALDLPPPDPGPNAEARTQLADLLTDMDSDDLVAFRQVVERLKAAEQKRLAQTIEGEGEEQDDDEGESEG